MSRRQVLYVLDDEQVGRGVDFKIVRGNDASIHAGVGEFTRQRGYESCLAATARDVQIQEAGSRCIVAGEAGNDAFDRRESSTIFGRGQVSAEASMHEKNVEPRVSEQQFTLVYCTEKAVARKGNDMVINCW